ncbi:hypothetical protein [Flammeovirga sp. SJP92]|uniref:hypothetical protein n=1 Tax=Flammeovirga sp. SJP92 TaxID=1775430 RepID=UPI000786B2E2|nr:hypothetical protein [Flammeovirga sp. SJP92]KXX67801.1 hypothetical protein AVL50_25400 [Flammeovirga sp. SJP92]
MQSINYITLLILLPITYFFSGSTHLYADNIECSVSLDDYVVNHGLFLLRAPNESSKASINLPGTGSWSYEGSTFNNNNINDILKEDGCYKTTYTEGSCSVIIYVYIWRPNLSSLYEVSCNNYCTDCLFRSYAPFSTPKVFSIPSFKKYPNGFPMPRITGSIKVHFNKVVVKENEFSGDGNLVLTGSAQGVEYSYYGIGNVDVSLPLKVDLENHFSVEGLSIQVKENSIDFKWVDPKKIRWYSVTKIVLDNTTANLEAINNASSVDAFYTSVKNQDPLNEIIVHPGTTTSIINATLESNKIVMARINIGSRQTLTVAVRKESNGIVKIIKHIGLYLNKVPTLPSENYATASYNNLTIGITSIFQ